MYDGKKLEITVQRKLFEYALDHRMHTIVQSYRHHSPHNKMNHIKFKKHVDKQKQIENRCQTVWGALVGGGSKPCAPKTTENATSFPSKISPLTVCVFVQKYQVVF